MIHAKGWKTSYCSPDPHAFLGCGPSDLPAAMRQQKRWAMGLLEILLSEHSPILATLTGKLQFRQCLGYLWLLIWGLRSIPELCYVALPAYCIITNTSFLPKVMQSSCSFLLHLLLINSSSLVVSCIWSLSLIYWPFLDKPSNVMTTLLHHMYSISTLTKEYLCVVV